MVKFQNNRIYGSNWCQPKFGTPKQQSMPTYLCSIESSETEKYLHIDFSLVFLVEVVIFARCAPMFDFCLVLASRRLPSIEQNRFLLGL